MYFHIQQSLWNKNNTVTCYSFPKNFHRLPTWTNKVFPGGSFKKIAIFSFKMDTNTKLLARLKVGFLLREILERFTMKKDLKLSPDRSMWIYSAHDGTIVNLLNALGVFQVNNLQFLIIILCTVSNNFRCEMKSIELNEYNLFVF